MMEKKYEITNESKVFRVYDRYVRVFRIRSLKYFGDVKKGDLGGWIESEDNLSYDGNCWIYDDGIVCNHARVDRNAKIRDNALVEVNAVITDSAKVYGHASVSYNAWVSSNAEVYDYAKIYGNCTVSGKSKVYGNAFITDEVQLYNTEVTNNIQLSGAIKIFNGYIKHYDNYLTHGPIGSRHDMVSFYRGIDNEIHASTGCFEGTLKQFEDAVNKTHKDNEKYRTDYLNLVKFIKENWRTKNGTEEIRDN